MKGRIHMYVEAFFVEVEGQRLSAEEALHEMGLQCTVEVPPGDVAGIHAGHLGEVPSLISVSHHITGGYIVEKVAFGPDSGLLSGILATKAGLNLVLFGHLPEGWTLSRESRFRGMAGKIGTWQHEVVTTHTHTPFAIRFERTTA